MKIDQALLSFQILNAKKIKYFKTLAGRILIRPGSYIAFLPCRMQFKQKIMKQIISLSLVSIAFDTAEMRRMNRDEFFVYIFYSVFCCRFPVTDFVFHGD